MRTFRVLTKVCRHRGRQQLYTTKQRAFLPSLLTLHSMFACQLRTGTQEGVVPECSRIWLSDIQNDVRRDRLQESQVRLHLFIGLGPAESPVT